MSSNKLSLAKQQLKGQLAISRESNNNIMLSYAKSLLVRNKIDSIETIHQKIDLLNASDLLEAAGDHLNEEDLDYLFFEGKSSN